MKKTFFVALAATVMTVGCQKTELLNGTTGPALSFTTVMNKLTKAQGTVDAENKGQKNLEAQDFSVWAYADPQSDFASVTVVNATTKIYDGIENLHVDCKRAHTDAIVGNGTNENPQTPAVEAIWKTAKEYYWPGENKNLRFFAVSADGSWLRPTATGSTCPVTIDYATPSLLVEDFEVKAAPVMDGETVVKTAANEDLMVADFIKQNQDDKVVDLTFRHTLSKVEFIFKTLAAENGATAPDVWVQSLSVAGMKYKGDLNVTPKDATAATIQWNFAWTPDPATTTFTDDWTGIATYLDGTDATTIADATAMKLTTSPQTFTTWLMIPQGITSDSKVSITYVINKRQFTSIFPLNGDSNTTISSWSCNQHIKYNVVLAPNTISFSPTVQDWTTPSINIEYQN